jgi:hypothetical protein
MSVVCRLYKTISISLYPSVSLQTLFWGDRRWVVAVGTSRVVKPRNFYLLALGDA